MTEHGRGRVRPAAAQAGGSGVGWGGRARRLAQAVLALDLAAHTELLGELHAVLDAGRGEVESSAGLSPLTAEATVGGVLAVLRRLAPGLLATALAVGCGGCESTQEKSAQQERTAKHERLALQGVSVARQSPYVRVLGTEVVHGKEASAVVVHLRDITSRPILNAPIAIAVRDAAGKVVYQNNQPGEDRSLTTVSLQTGSDAVWIDDQVRGEGVPVSASAKVGEGQHPATAAPKLSVEGLHASGEGSEASAEGSIKNQSSTTQLNLVVFVLARGGGKTVAAGRAVLPEVLPGASDSFQVFFVGDPSGAKLQASVPPTSY